MNIKKRHFSRSFYVILILLGLLIITPYERSHYTCLQCRLDNQLETYWLIPITTYTPNECSAWYTSKHPNHKHDWKKSSCTYGRLGLLGFTSRYGCSRGHPVFAIDPYIQQIYLSTNTEQQQEIWFALLNSEREEDNSKAFALAHQAFEKQVKIGQPTNAPYSSPEAGSNR